MNQTQPTNLQAAGDTFFAGVDQRNALMNPEGVLADGENLRFTNGWAESRKGVAKPAWANTVSGSVITRHGDTPYGAGVFRDPNGREWGIIAVDGYAYRLRPHNYRQTIPLPNAVKLLGPVTFVQAFNKLFAFRGRYLAPLVMTDFDTGFADIVSPWSSSTTYAALTEVSWGPFQNITSITRSGNTATVTTASDHGYITGADITMINATQTEYNGRFNITVTSPNTFTYQVSGSPATPATTASTLKCSNMIYYWKAAGTLYTLTSITRSGATATATKASHGFSNGQSVTIAGATQTEYNGTFTISNVTANTFDYTVTGTPATPATGTITVRNANTIANHDPDTYPNDWTRTYNVLPNADTALFINNRLLVPTAYEPSSADSYATFNGGSYTKTDFIVATDYQDETHFTFADEFRINQGSDDEIVDLVKFAEDTVIVFKNRSWGLLSNISALSNGGLTLDFRETGYGLASRGGAVKVGSDVYFYAGTRGIVSIKQSENGKIMSVDVPLSAPIARTLNRINGPLVDQVRLTTWQNKLYVAVPLDDATLTVRPPDAPVMGISSGQGPNATPTISWTAVTGATSYKIYGGVPGTSSTLMKTTTETSWTLTLAEWQAFDVAAPYPDGRVWMTALNDRGASANSNLLSIATSP